MGSLLFGILVLACYMLPWLIAIRRRHRNRSAIACLNFFLGWTGIGWLAALAWAVLGSRGAAEEVARKPSRIGRIVTVSVLLLFFGIASAPHLLLFPVYREGVRLVPLLEQYKAAHGVYPATLDDLGIAIRYNSPVIRGIRYYVLDGGKEFSLVCFVARPGTTNLREGYSSKTKQWVAYH